MAPFRPPAKGRAMLPDAPTLLSALAALLIVLGLIWLASRGARIAGFTPRLAKGRVLRVQDCIALDSRRRLHLVACGERDVLLLTGGGTDIVVGWVQHAQPNQSVQDGAS